MLSCTLRKKCWNKFLNLLIGCGAEGGDVWMDVEDVHASGRDIKVSLEWPGINVTSMKNFLYTEIRYINIPNGLKQVNDSLHWRVFTH